MEAQLGADLTVAARAALLHYRRRLSSSSTPVAPPRFSDGRLFGNGGQAFELAVDPEIEAILESQALRYGVSMEQILAHAILIYLADVDSASQQGAVAVPGDLGAPLPAG